jgi:hypothetical protein
MLLALTNRYGQRGVWLMLMGGVYIVFGIGNFLEPTAAREWVLFEYLPAPVQAALWWVTGAVAVWQGARGRAADDWLGHVALYLAPAVRVVSFALAWLLYTGTELLVSLGCRETAIGFDRGWYAALIWIIVSTMLGLAASWPNSSTPIPMPPLGEADND